MDTAPKREGVRPRDDASVLAVDAQGDELLAVELGTTHPQADPHVPLTGALVVVTSPLGILLVHDVWRDAWELAGGGIDDGETSAQAAAREVWEESGQRLTGRTWVGRARLRLADGRLEEADLFTGEVHTVLPFAANSETDVIQWWDGVCQIDGLGVIDAVLIDRVRRQGAEYEPRGPQPPGRGT